MDNVIIKMICPHVKCTATDYITVNSLSGIYDVLMALVTTMQFCIYILPTLKEIKSHLDCHNDKPNEPRREKTGLRDFRPAPTQTGLYSHTRWLEAWNIVFR